MKFAKIHGLGNDYVLINALKENLSGIKFDDLARKMSNRHFGIGSDGIILILPSNKADFKMRIFNSDGSEAEMCGNGIRGFAKYVYEHGLTKNKEITVETLAGIIKPKIIDGMITVNMGEPVLDSKKIPMICDKQKVINEDLKLKDGTVLKVTCVSMGNPHCIVFVETFGMPVEKIGYEIEHHKAFPKKTNVEFIQIINKREIAMQVWERGAGVTLACGTGASAAVVASVLNGKTDRKVTVHLLGGDLNIEWNEKDNNVYMTGPAEEVYEGEYNYK
ncbi:MAG: diaminopimelate epimerase [Candidatus Woesearchaeota archaeon]|nr:diaminopimelate epimerase [Candidatus Woesearchaeota archaeon]